MYFPNAFRKSFLPVAASAATLTTSGSLTTTTGTVLLTSTTGTVTAGMAVSGTGIAPGTTVVSVVSNTSVTLSLPIIATVPASTTITAGPTTFTTTAVDRVAPNLIIASATISGVSVGQSVSGTNIATGTTVLAVSGTTLTLSQNVTGTISTGATITIGSSVSLASSGTTAALTAGQLGFFNSKTYAALLTPSTTPFIIAQGSYFTQDKIGPVHGGYQESVKSKVINPHYISRVIKVNAKTPVNQVVKVSVGAGVTADATYRLRLDVKGSPALRFLNHQLYRTVDAYTGCANTTNPTYVRDAVSTLLLWKDAINSYPTIKDMIQARVYKLAVTNTTTGANATAVSTTQATFVPGSFTSIAVGQKVVGTGIPANAFVTTVNGTTNVTITYPTQATAPAASVFNAKSIKYYNDIYSTSGVVAYIPGTQSESGVGGSLVKGLGVATGLTSTAYTPDADAASITTDAHIEFTVAYMETKFGTCTFTPTDKYDIEPLIIYASVVDEDGDPCSGNPFIANTTDATGIAATTPYLSSHGFEVQTPVQAFGVGETVLRELILDGRYLQNAYPDSSRVESFRMREIEADPALSTVSRTGYYDKVLILHNVPRFYNPSATFDNDQYLIVVHVPKGTDTSALTNFIVSSANLSQGSGTISLEGENIY